MADKKFTLLELHLGDGTVQVGPATLGSESGAGDEEPTAEADGGGCACPGRKAGKLLAVVVLLVVVAAAARKLLGADGDLDELEDLAEFDEE